MFSLDCSSRYAQATNLCQTSNFGNIPYLAAEAWTRYGTPAIIRSYLRFGGLNFTGSVRLDTALLSLFDSGHSSELSGSNAFMVSKVAGAWEENTINWVNQPGASSPSVPGPPGFETVVVNVTPIVRDWMANPGSNYGFLLSLQNESYYRSRSFWSSEGGPLPQLIADVSNPSAKSDTVEITTVNKGDEITLQYASNGNVYSSNTQVSKQINGKQVTGQQFIFNVVGLACGNTAYSEHVQAFGWLAKQELTLFIPDNKGTWPYLPPQNNGDSRGADRLGYDPILKNIKITVLKGGKPLANTQIVIKTLYHSKTGGHLHTNPPLPQSKQGVFMGQGKSGNPITLTTDKSGIAKIDSFRASQISGLYTIKAYLKTDTTVQDSDIIKVRVPHLVDFSKINSGGQWRLTGARTGVHESNHWIDSLAEGNLVAAIKDFNNWMETSHKGIKLCHWA